MMVGLAVVLAVVAEALGTGSTATSIPPKIVYFGPGSAVPNRTQALQAIQEAVAGGPAYISVPVGYLVEGHTDRAGPAALNLRLACDRAQAVRRLMIAEGIPPGHILIQAYGESRPAIETPDDLPDEFNRRVEISYRPLPLPEPSVRTCL